MKKAQTNSIGIADQLTINHRRSAECVKGLRCPAYQAAQGIGGVRILKDGQYALEASPDGSESMICVKVGIDWNGKALVLDPVRHRRIDITTLRTICSRCGETIHSWRDLDGQVSEGDL